MLPVKAIVSTDFTVDPFFSVDDNGHIVGINEAAAIATGLNETELTSTLFIDLFTDRAEADKMLHEVMEKGIVNNFSLTFSSENGHAEKPVILNAMMFVDKSIDTRRVFVFTHEFSASNNNNGDFERISDDQENAKNETLFRSTLDKMLEGVQIIGFDWRFIYVNDALAQQAKYTKEQLLGHTVMEMYPGFEHLAIYKEY
ncbi:MAG: PAS domain-containing protein, partial [Ferruginibacter sp.]